VEERKYSGHMTPPDKDEERTWVNYAVGVVAQYFSELPKEGCSLDIALAISTDIPLGAGLSSSAALVVSVATFLECIIHDDYLYSTVTIENDADKLKQKALRCQKAENEWAHVPAGIMDQYTSCAGEAGQLLLIDCRSLEIQKVPMKPDKSEDRPVFLITDSKVSHEFAADSEYGLRRRQLAEALDAMQQVPLYHILSMRDANLADCEKAKDKMTEIEYKRAVHVVTENKRTNECKIALKMGLWDRVGELMNASHASLRDDYQVSCPELDTLVDIAQGYEGVYGSRLTGGGFGGCTVTFCKKSVVDGLVEALKTQYKEKWDLGCTCFVTEPCEGARVIGFDKDCKAHE
jgi:galactokinase